VSKVAVITDAARRENDDAGYSLMAAWPVDYRLVSSSAFAYLLTGVDTLTHGSKRTSLAQERAQRSIREATSGSRRQIC
jgi:hypothetical protein